MNNEIFCFVMFCGLPIIGVGIIALSYIQRISQFQEVLANGIETTAVVVRKYGRYRIVVEYRDYEGKMYRRDFEVLPSEYHRFTQGEAVGIFYSTRRPHIFAFKETIEQARAAAQSRREPPAP
ncbi:MAG: hypothetical protein WHS83_14850 [Chloroflexus sp.]|uniref:hypothetical protein n=1 Tax=Chloroflexus TaxID=1107 RepID=UPI000173B145|nr:hypothetical protein [Chloroflexus aurantiacus]